MTGGGDLDKLSLTLLLFEGTGLDDFPPRGRSLRGVGLRLRLRGLEYDRSLPRDRDLEWYDGERPLPRPFLGPWLTDELLRRYEPPRPDTPRPRGDGLRGAAALVFGGGEGDRLYEL